MHFISLTSIAFLGLSVIAPLVVAHPADTSSKVVSHKPTPYKAPPHKTSPKVQPHKTTAAAVSTPTSDPTWADLEAECYHVSSPKCDKAYAEFEAAYLKAHPGYNTVEPYPDSKRKSNVCKCTGSLLDGGYKGVCKYGDGFGYMDSVCLTGRGMCCTWCCRGDAVDGYGDNCVATTQDPNCPGDGPDSRQS